MSARLDTALMAYLLTLGRAPSAVADALGLGLGEVEACAVQLGLAAPAATVPAGHVGANYAAILHWAAERGLAPAGQRLDVGAVNACRVRLGLRPFALVSRRTLATAAGAASPTLPPSAVTEA